MTLFLQDEWLTGDIGRSSDNSLSWATRISRTRVSTVDGLNLTDSVDNGMVQSLEGVLHAVQRLRIKCIPFQEIEEIREVGQGETFKVSQCRFNNNVVAIKHVRRGDTESSSQKSSFRRNLQSVVKEVLIMHHAPLDRHPNIIGLLGYGWRLHEGRPSPYMIVEYGTKGSLRQYLASTQNPLRAKMSLAGDVACGLMALHACGIVHGDLKLENIVLFAKHGQPTECIAKICDFGHSILVGDSPEKESRYYGTPIYNAPEVLSQTSAPIARENLHKCDIWAFGLLVWEIILDGSRYFRKEWRHDPNLLRPTSPELPRPSPAASSMNRDEGNTAVFDNDKVDIVFGRFDPKHLRKLAKQDANNIDGTNMDFEKGYLRALFEKTLVPEPHLRWSNLARLPFVTHLWNELGSTTALQASMAAYTGDSRFSYDLFKREHAGHVTWAHEVHILDNLETVCTSSHHIETVRSALFHTSLCFINAFGTSRDDTKATQYFRKADEQGHLMAGLLWPQISGVIAHVPFEQPSPYYTFLKRAFLIGRTFPWSQSLKVVFSFDDYSSTCIQYSSYREASTALHRLTDPTKLTIEIANGVSFITMNLLETAIAFQDVELVSEIAHKFDVFHEGAWNESPLQQAIRHGDPGLLSVLLTEMPVRCRRRIEDIQCPEVLLWLFCMPDVDSMNWILDLLPWQSGRINAVLPVALPLHEQWAFKLRGTPLAVAVMAGDHRAVQVLLDRGADPLCAAFESDADDEIWTPLHLAVRDHQAQLFEMMWASKVKMLEQATRRRLERFPLPCALSYSTVAERFAIHGRSHGTALQKILWLPLGPLRAKSATGQTALLRAIDLEDFAVVDALLTREPKLAKQPLEDPLDPQAFTYPLHFAAQIGSQRDSSAAVDIFRRILDSDRTKLMRQISNGSTALHMAATGVSGKIMQCLLDENVSTAIFDDQGRTALHKCRTAVSVRILFDHGANMEGGTTVTGTAMHNFASLGLVEPFRELISCGASVNAHCNAVGSVMHAAVQKKSYEMVQSLLQAGADVNGRYDDDDRTVLELAIELGHLKIAGLLLDAGANPLALHKQGINALQLSLRNGATQLFRKMLELSIEDISSYLWATMIHEAATTVDDKTILEAMLEACKSRPLFDIDVHRGSLTPLMAAAQHLRTDTMKVLLDYGADIHARDDKGNSTILLVCNTTSNIERGSSRHSACLLLFCNGADVMDVNNEGLDCLVLAQRKWDRELTNLLTNQVLGRVASNQSEVNQSEVNQSEMNQTRDQHSKPRKTLLRGHAKPLVEYFKNTFAKRGGNPSQIASPTD